MSARPRDVRLAPCPASCSTTATRRTTAVSCSPRSRATTARSAASQHSPRAAPADTQSGGPWKPPPRRKPSRCSRPTSLSGPPQPGSAQSTFHDRLGRSPSRPKGATMTTFATQMVPPSENAEGPRPVAGQPRGFSPGELAFLIGVPLLWGILLLFHPGGGEGTEITYMDLQDKVTAWLVVHIGMMLFIPLMAAVVYLLLRGVEGTAARISRIALVPFVIFYSAWEVSQGIGVGILVNELKGLPQAEQALREDLVQDFAEHTLIGPFGVFGSIGSMGLIVAMIAAGVALYRHADAPVAVPVLLAISGLLITVHPPPYGPTGLGLFIVAVLLFVRSQSQARAT